MYYFFVIFFGIASFALAEVNLEKKIPFDEDIRYGILDNGLTYYVKENQNPKNKAQIHLIIKAGSLMEDDDQLGLAHLIEHMAFNGTKNFPKNEIDEYLNSIGLSIGADFNASTGFERTIYTLDIPTNKVDDLEKGIHILADISSNATLSDAAFEKERKIVEEEWRQSLGKQQRLGDELKKISFKNSQFASRSPIGEMEIIKNFDYKTAIRYYDDWYRPDLMAVVAVGDFDELSIERMIKKYFSEIKAKNSERIQPSTQIPDYGETIYLIQEDTEQEDIEFTVLSKNKSIKLETLGDLREEIIKSICSRVIQKRLSSLLIEENTPVIDAYIGDYNFTIDNNFHYYGATLKEGKIKEGIDYLLTEIERVKKNGFLIDELENTKKEIIESAEQFKISNQTRATNSIVNELTRNFLEDEFVAGADKEFELRKKILKTITLTDLNQYFSLNWSVINNRIINLRVPEKLNDNFNKEDFVIVENKVKKSNINQFKSLIKDEPLIKEKLTGSIITETIQHSTIGTTELRLSNGIKVFLKPTTNKKESFHFQALSMGGHSHASLDELWSAKMLEAVSNESIVGSFSRIELNNKINPSFADVNITLNS